MKNKIKNWLGVTKLENTVGEFKSENKKEEVNFPGWFTWSSWTFADNSLVGRYKSLLGKHDALRKDFEELDEKFDALERYLQIEYYKEDKETQVYDWADKKHSEGFRKTAKTYEQMKKAEENKDSARACVDEDDD